MNLFILWITNNIFRILSFAAVTDVLEPIDFHYMNKNGTNTLQNILYCDSQKNDSQTSLEQHEGYDHNISFFFLSEQSL